MKNKKKIILGSDHGGFKLKEQIKKYFQIQGINYIDLGNRNFNPNDDYPFFALKVAKRVVKEKGWGVLFCRSGAGMAIAANKIKGIRAAQAFSPSMARKAKEDDNVNVLCLGSDYLSREQVKKIINAWLQSKPSKAKRHQRRINQIKNTERKRK